MLTGIKILKLVGKAAANAVIWIVARLEKEWMIIRKEGDITQKARCFLPCFFLSAVLRFRQKSSKICIRQRVLEG